MKYILIVLKIICVVITALSVGYFILTYFFNWTPTLIGQAIQTKSIYESKKYKVFISEYFIPKNEIKLLQNNKLIFNETWLEHSWIFDSWANPIITNNKINSIVFIIDTANSKFANKKYSIQYKNYECWFNPKINNRLSMAIEMPHKSFDTLNLILKELNLNNNIYEPITEFILVKK